MRIGDLEKSAVLKAHVRVRRSTNACWSEHDNLACSGAAANALYDLIIGIIRGIEGSYLYWPTRNNSCSRVKLAVVPRALDHTPIWDISDGR